MATFTEGVAEVIESNISSDYQAEQVSIQVIQLFLTVCERDRFQIKLRESIIATQLFATNITNVTSNVQHTLLLSSAVTTLKPESHNRVLTKANIISFTRCAELDSI